MQILFVVCRIALAVAVVADLFVPRVVLGADGQASGSPTAPMHRGYYTYPAVRGENIVFTSEGDLWVVGAKAGWLGG